MYQLLRLAIIFCFLSGCYQTSLAPMMVAPVAGVSQGKAATSIASTAFNYGIKEKTGKFPYEHIIKREKQKIVNKVAAVEKTVIETSEEIKLKIDQSSKKVINIKKQNTEKFYASANKIKKITKETFRANRPQNSYWSTQK